VENRVRETDTMPLDWLILSTLPVAASPATVTNFKKPTRYVC